MKYIGLLTDQQKRAGYFATQDDDFIYLWHGRDGFPNIIAVFLYETVTVKEIRDKINMKMRSELCSICETNEADFEGVICHDCKAEIDEMDFRDELRHYKEEIVSWKEESNCVERKK